MAEKIPGPGKPTRPRVRRGSEEDAQKLRAELLDAALSLFSEQGIDGVTMRALATRVGVSAMTPYRYFEDKGHLLRGILADVLGSAYARMRAASTPQPDARARIRASVGAFFDYWEENPQHYRLIYMTEQTTRPDELGLLTKGSEYRAPIEDTLDSSRALALEIGGDPARAKLASDLRFMMVSGYLHGHLVNRRYPWSEPVALRRRYIEEIIAMMERCLLASETPPPEPPEPPSASGAAGKARASRRARRRPQRRSGVDRNPA